MDQIRGAVDSIPAPVKFVAGAILVIIVLVFLWNQLMAFLQDWEPIAIGLDPRAQSEALQYLRDNNIPYKIKGGSILVHKESADEVRIEMAGQDFSVTPLLGLERLNEVGMGDTEKTVAAKRQLALQEEIQKGLNQISAIESSQVTLALPPESGFITRTQAPAKASIVLRLAPGRTFNPNQIEGIQKLVANSVQGLSPENVTILDHNSNPLSQDMQGDAALNNVALDEARRIEQNVKTLLEPKVGVNGVRVVASVELIREKKTETQRVIDTANPAETTYTSKEIEDTTGRGSGGVPGAESNTGEGVAGAGGQTGGSYTESEESRQTDYSTTLTEVEYLPGTIKRKSVAVMINLKEQETTDENNRPTTEYVSWGDETLQQLKQAVKDAVGIDDAAGGRGDSLTLEETLFDFQQQQALEFRKNEEVVQQRKMLDIFNWSDWTALIKIPLLIMFVFAIAWYVIRPIGKKIMEPVLALPSQAAGALPEEMPKSVEELEAEIEGKLEDEIDIAAKEVTKGTILKKRIGELAKNEPETFVQLIRTWLNE